MSHAHVLEAPRYPKLKPQEAKPEQKWWVDFGCVVQVDSKRSVQLRSAKWQVIERARLQGEDFLGSLT